MNHRLLPFEREFRNWVDERGMGWVASAPGERRSTGAAATLWITPTAPARRVVFALHGAGNDALFGWIGLFKQLLLDGAAIYTFDLPGHGRISETVFDAGEAGNAVRHAFSDCAELAAGLPVHAVGVSLGGSVLLSTLPSLGGRLASATLVVAPLQIQISVRSFVSELRPHNLRLVWREREHYGLTGLIPSFGPFKRDLYPLRLADAPPPGPFGYVTSLNRALAAMDLEEAARRVEIPVLLAYGVHDRVVPIGQGERLARLLPCREFLRVAGGTHLSTPMEMPVRSEIVRWIARWG